MRSQFYANCLTIKLILVYSYLLQNSIPTRCVSELEDEFGIKHLVNFLITHLLQVRMMYQKSKFQFGRNDDLKCLAIELPYAGDQLSMFVLLPDGDLADLEKALTFDDLVNVRRRFQMTSVEVKLSLPKFRLDERLSLASSLGLLGMRDLFDDGAADLSGIDGTRELYVSSVLHRAVVDVGEEGTLL